MIVTDLANIEHQVPMTGAMRRAIDFLRQEHLRHVPDGRVEIDGDRVYAMVQRYETVKPAMPTFEHHRVYVDVQYIVSGEEVIGWAPAGRMKITEAYHNDKDICFGNVDSEVWTPVRLETGQLAVFWPEDAHAPKLASRTVSTVMKIVVKIAV